MGDKGEPVAEQLGAWPIESVVEITQIRKCSACTELDLPLNVSEQVPHFSKDICLLFDCI